MQTNKSTIDDAKIKNITPHNNSLLYNVGRKLTQGRNLRKQVVTFDPLIVITDK